MQAAAASAKAGTMARLQALLRLAKTTTKRSYRRTVRASAASRCRFGAMEAAFRVWRSRAHQPLAEKVRILVHDIS